jgi:hypothetical protein
MTKILVTAQVQDPTKWEKSFRTHGELFRNQSMSTPLSYGVIEGNTVAVYGEVNNLDTWRKTMDSPAMVEAMAADGVKRETVKTFVLDRELKV